MSWRELHLHTEIIEQYKNNDRVNLKWAENSFVVGPSELCSFISSDKRPVFL